MPRPDIANVRALLLVTAISLAGGAVHLLCRNAAEPVSAVPASPARAGVRPSAPPVRHRDALALSLEEVLALPEPTHRLEELTDRALAVPRGEIPQVMASLPASLLESPYAVVLVQRWAEDSPEAAVRWAGNLAKGTAREGLLVAAAIAWAEEDVSAARGWVGTLIEVQLRERLLLELAQAVADTRPLDSLAMACDLPDSPAREDLISASLRQWSALSPDEAAEWALGLPDAMSRQRAVAEVSTTLARTDSLAAIDLALDHIADDRVLAAAILGVVSQASGGNPELIRDWIDRFPEGPLKHAARAEFTRIERGLLPSPKGLPGEDAEDRAPYPPR